jgi:glycerol-3-phosphate dehydrogenase
LLPLEILPGVDALLIPKTEDGRVLFAIPWMGRLLVGTTEQEVDVHDELYVTKNEVDYLLHHLNKYLERPVGPDQVVSCIAGARPLVSSGESRDTQKLARDDELEIDATSGLISIMGGKWTTYRAMAEDTINAAQQQLGIPQTECPTINHRLAGAEGFTSEYWQTLVAQHGISEETARHLAEKFGTRASRVMEIATQIPALAEPVLDVSPILRAEVAYCARSEMALTIEDVLARRVGMQLYSWRSAIQAAPVVASVLRTELGWSADAERNAIDDYVGKINRYLELAGLSPESAANGAAAHGAGGA